MNTSVASSPSKNVMLITSVLLFLVVFGQWQLYDLTLMNVSLDPLFVQILYLSMPATNIIVYALFVKFTKSTFRKQGFKSPSPISGRNCVLLTLLFVAIYIFFILASGIMGSFGPLQLPVGPASIVYRIANATLFGLATETIFRGYIFRNLLKTFRFFPSLYASAVMFSISQISVNNMLSMSSEQLGTYIFTHILTTLAAGLFLAFFFYKTGWSLLGPVIFQVSILLYFEPSAILSPSSPWWMLFTFEVAAFAILILLVDATVIEPRYRRKKYGLEV